MGVREEEKRAAFLRGLGELFAERARERERNPTEEQSQQRSLAESDGVVRCASRLELVRAAMLGLASGPLAAAFTSSFYGSLVSAGLSRVFPTKPRWMLAAGGGAAVLVALLNLAPKFAARGPGAVMVKYDERRRRQDLFAVVLLLTCGLFAQLAVFNI